MTLGIVLQSGSVSSAVSQLVQGIAGPVLQAVLTIGGFSLVMLIIMGAYYLIEYIVHPTSFGRSSALTEGVNVLVKRLGFGLLGLFLTIYIFLFVIAIVGSQVGASTISTGEALTYAEKILAAMLTQFVNVFKAALSSAGVP